MSVRTLLFFVQFILLSASTHTVMAQKNDPIGHNDQHHASESEGREEEECPVPSNIQVEFLPNGEAIVTWDAIPNVTVFHVHVTDANQHVIFDDFVSGNQVHISNLEAGERYNVRICYFCQSSERDICSAMTFTYVIINDVIVMLGGDPCNCDKNATKDGFCSHSNSDYYKFINPGIYTVKLVDSSEMTFESSFGVVKAIGNCPLSNFKMNSEKHGILGAFLPYYAVDTSKIHFHGTRFCVSGASVAKVTYCAYEGGRSHELSPQREGSVFPNPFKDLVRVAWPAVENDDDLPLNVQVFDARGQLVYKTTYTSFDFQQEPLLINLEGLANGLYWLSISGEGVAPTVHRLQKIE